MGRPCHLCQHVDRKAIEAAVRSGTSYGEAAALYPPLSKAAVGRHMKDHASPLVCEAASDLDPLAFLSPPPPVRVRERPSVNPVSLEPPVQAGNVVPFRDAVPPTAELEIATREEATPRMVAILLLHGYSISDIAQRFGLVDQGMSALLSDVEDAYMRQATGSSSMVIVGKMIFKAEYAIAELEGDYQEAKRQGRNRDARECRRLILAERQELREMLREYRITRPMEVDDFDSKPKQDMNEIYQAVKNSINGVFPETAPIPTVKQRLIG